jgi:phospholipid N-methyltransferase
LSTTALVLGVEAARASLSQLGDYDEIVVLDSDVAALEALVSELADPRLDYMLGGLPVLPMPDDSVDLLVGADAADPEVVRVLRPDGRVVSSK